MSEGPLIPKKEQDVEPVEDDKDIKFTFKEYIGFHEEFLLGSGFLSSMLYSEFFLLATFTNNFFIGRLNHPTQPLAELGLGYAWG